MSGGAAIDMDTREGVDAAFRAAAMRWHPNRGGDPEKFKDLEQAKRLILAAL